MCIATINVRIIENKVEQVKETSKLGNTDFIILMETWLKDTYEDQARVATSGLDNEEYRIDTVNYHTKKGGGVALLHKKEYRATRIQNSEKFKTIEYGAWETTIKNIRITIIGIYHPPIGKTTSNTCINSLEEVSQLVQYFITYHQI